MKSEKNETEQLKNVYNKVKTEMATTNQNLLNLKGSLSRVRMKLIELYVQEELILKHNIKDDDLEKIRNGIFELDNQYEKLFDAYKKLCIKNEVDEENLRKKL
ncbi:MAG: hypothetical protein ACRCYE_13500 [Sarcina sp.]